MTDVKNKKRRVLKDFIKIYQSEPCLWQYDCKDYKDENKKEVAYQRLAKKLKEIDPKADSGTVENWLFYLHTERRKEKKQIAESLKTGIIYKPTLWYYDKLNFLDINKNPKNVPASENSRNNLIHTLEDKPTDSVTTQNLKLANERTTRKTDTVIRNQTSKLSNERFDLLGKSVAIKMHDITDDAQKLFAEKIINDTMFMAEMNQLTPAHTIVAKHQKNKTR